MARMLSLREVIKGVMADVREAEANGELGSDPSTWEHPWLADIPSLRSPAQADTAPLPVPEAPTHQPPAAVESESQQLSCAAQR